MTPIEILETDYAEYRGSLHLYDDYLTLERPGGEAYCIDPHDVATAFSTLPLGTGLLPEGCLFWGKQAGQERLGLYLAPQVWPVSVQGEQLTWHIPLPGLVFVGHGTNYNLWALKGGWPEADTELYLAPCPNVYGDRGICQGNAPFPEASVATIRQAVEVFFTSGFNGDLSNGKSKKHRDNVLKLWRELDGKKKYPVKDLVQAGIRLQELANG